MFRRLKQYWIFILVAVLLASVGCINYIVNKTTEKQLYSDVTLIPKNKVGLLLGTAKFKDKGRHIINPYYQNRIDATVALYMAGKIDYIIVSGDSATYYNEPAEMKADLISRGVPAERVYVDNAGFRTLDSILRCRDIFNEHSVTIISQQFHNQRALYIANHKHVNAIAYNAADGGSKTESVLREKLARVKMMYDLLFNTQARYYGQQIEIK